LEAQGAISAWRHHESGGLGYIMLGAALVIIVLVTFVMIT